MKTDTFLEKAREVIVNYVTKECKGLMDPEDLQVVWMAHTMGDKKAVLFSPKAPGELWEITYDMRSKALYMDRYSKTHHSTVELDEEEPPKDADMSETERALKHNQEMADRLLTTVFRSMFLKDKNTSVKDEW